MLSERPLKAQLRTLLIQGQGASTEVRIELVQDGDGQAHCALSRHQNGPEEKALADVVPHPQLECVPGGEDEPEGGPRRAGDQVHQAAAGFQSDAPLALLSLDGHVELVQVGISRLDLHLGMQNSTDDVPAGHPLVHHDGGVAHLVGQRVPVCEDLDESLLTYWRP